MKITRLNLTNYRGVHSLSLDFQERLNVFFGVNGAGKSTILDAVAIMLSWAVSRIRYSGASSGRPIQETDITNGKSSSSVQLDCIEGDQPIEWRLSKSRKGHGAPEDRSNLANLNEFTKRLQGQISERAEKINLPLFAYYPVNRAVLDIPLRIREKHSFKLFAAFDDVLTSGANFRTFFEWFREREDLENENRKYSDQLQLFKPENFQFPDPQLETVRGALQSFLPEFANLTVRRSPLRMEVEKNGKLLTVNQLSDGEKCLIAMVGDLARRMAIANPERSDPLEGEGIILIDEIDLHLHPKWQRMIVPRLLEVFPKCQFIISTHSPHVITHVQPESLYLLKQTDSGIVAERPAESYGKNVDRILEDLMGLETTRPDRVSSSLHDIYDEINQGQFADARQKIADMKAEIGEDPELVKAEVLIKRKEIIGK
ncbi:MAG: AAA family ATPase [Deltaproteobacteria bacterium]|nr:AAA family ATPase [Deltaproteobacteria bacterium]